MSSCAILWCGKNSRFSCTKTDEVTFHRFPKDKAIKKKWIEATKRDNWRPSNFSVICSRHFTEDCYHSIKPRRRLLDNAIPTLNLPVITFDSLINEFESDQHLKASSMARNASAQEPISIMLPLKERDSPEPVTEAQIDYEELYKEITSYNVKRLCDRISELKESVDRKDLNVRRLKEQVRYFKRQIAIMEKTIKDLDEKCNINEENENFMVKITNPENGDVLYKYDITQDTKKTKKRNRKVKPKKDVDK
ncbi:PREDICTED: THAP domain-containing protein 1-like [Papilio xuthus]|uniref:THAP domain-containing protein 1-like n=1 Tax=Papilio xuthus TaxID=66420 RepID=A0AAJ6ZKG3_PAPXU|nr:PREDICTED: THAP domain-containing protein 1-like [Papilio xuthus]